MLTYEFSNYFPKKEESLLVWMNRNLLPLETYELKILKEWHNLFDFEKVFQEIWEEKLAKKIPKDLARIWFCFYYFHEDNQYKCAFHNSDLKLVNGFEATIELIFTEEFQEISTKYSNAQPPATSFEKTDFYSTPTVFLSCENCTKEVCPQKIIEKKKHLPNHSKIASSQF